MISVEHPLAIESVVGAALVIVCVVALLGRALQVRRERVKLADMLGLMKALFESGHVPKTQTIPGGGILRANKSFCRMLGYTEDELQELHWKDITHPDDRGEARDAVNGMMEAGNGASEAVTFFVRYRTKDNGYVPAFVSVTYVNNRDCEGILLAEIQQTGELERRHSETMEIRDLSFLDQTMNIEKRGSPLQGS